MRCPFCGSRDTRVIDSRLAGDGDQVRRRRNCPDCDERFTTYETVELSLPKVIKRDGSRVPFDETRLRGGLARALEKRPVSADAMEAALTRVQKALIAAGEREVHSRRIGELVMDELKGLDQVAFVRYASVYRSFEDVQAFREEVERLERELPADALRDQLPLIPND